ncbi:MAG: PilZ domain-containing protein [Vulcanimicrobiaceae bacterium]
MFKALFGGGGDGIPATKLPQVNSFIDVVVAGRPSRSVTVESVGGKGIVTRELVGRVGEGAVLLYTTGAGRFRASSKIVASSGSNTVFEFPKKVDLVGTATGAQKRQSVRLDALVIGQWRFAPGGKGMGEFVRATIRDISRGGCSIITDRALKHGTMVEVKMDLNATGASLVLLGEVMRHEEIKTSGKQSHGLRFQGVRPEEDHAIIEFINRKQTELRSRGLA